MLHLSSLHDSWLHALIQTHVLVVQSHLAFRASSFPFSLSKTAAAAFVAECSLSNV